MSISEILMSLLPQDNSGTAMIATGACILGAYHGTMMMKRFLQGVWKHVLRPSYDLKRRYADGGEAWAVVTGAAMGIGQEYALQLASAGFNIVAIDKDSKAMDQTKALISRKGGIVKTIIWDFGNIRDGESYAEFERVLKETTDGLDISVLINNAAEFQQESLDMISVERLFRASNVNSLTPALLARFFLPKMLARKHSTGKKSAIINVGTNAAEIQNPRYKFAVYGASKGYLHILSSGMQEVWGKDIDIMTAIPRQTKTPMCPVNFCFTASAKDHVKAVLSQLGKETQTYGTMTHDLEYFMRFGMIGGFIFNNIVQWLNEKENKQLIHTYNKRLN